MSNPEQGTEDTTSSPSELSPSSAAARWSPRSSPQSPKTAAKPSSPISRATHEGMLGKFSTGAGLLNIMKNWKERYFVVTRDGLSYYARCGDATPKGHVSWDRVTDVLPDVTPSQHSSAVRSPNSYYFALCFQRSSGGDEEFTLLMRATSDYERDTWLSSIEPYVSHLPRVASLLQDRADEDDVYTSPVSEPIDPTPVPNKYQGGVTRPTSPYEAPRTEPQPMSALQDLRQMCTTHIDKMTDVANCVAAAAAHTVSASARLVDPTVALRHVVSKKKLRYVRDGFDLDLSYITDRIIAMGFPATGREGMYRNQREEVESFLEQHHGSHYRVYNLCEERVYPVETFRGQFRHYPFRDHNPPSLRVLDAIVLDMEEYLREDARNVVAVHCKAGKGRTGCVIATYLASTGAVCSAEEAMRQFGEARTSNGRGITIPSQQRYVEYGVDLWVSRGRKFSVAPIRPVALVLSEWPVMDPLASLFVVITRPDGTCLLDTRSKAPRRHSASSDSLDPQSCETPVVGPHVVSLQQSPGVMVDGDFHVEVYVDHVVCLAKRLYGFWLHSMFLDPNGGQLSLRRRELDGEGRRSLSMSFSAIFVYRGCL